MLKTPGVPTNVLRTLTGHEGGPELDRHDLFIPPTALTSHQKRPLSRATPTSTNSPFRIQQFDQNYKSLNSMLAQSNEGLSRGRESTTSKISRFSNAARELALKIKCEQEGFDVVEINYYYKHGKKKKRVKKKRKQ